MPWRIRKRDKGDQRERADLLRALPDAGHGREHFIDGLFRLERRLVLSRRVEHIVAIKSVGQFFGDEVPEQQPACRLAHVFVDHGQAERFAAADPGDYRFAPRIGRARMGFDEFHLREHLTVPGGLKKAHVRSVGVDDVHVCRD